MTRASLIATLSGAPSLDGKELSGAAAVCRFRASTSRARRQLNPEWLRSHFRGELLYELNVERDLNEALLSRIPVENRIVSWHGEAADVAQLQRKFEEICGGSGAFLQARK